MATAPEFGSTPNKGTPASLTAANTSRDGTGSSGRALVLTASSGKGTFLPYIRVKHKGTNVASMITVFKNNGSDPEVAANNILIAEAAIAANTLSQTSESTTYDIPLDLALKGDVSTPERIYVLNTTAVDAGLAVCPMNAADL
jgi:hypothetical protein